MHTDSHGQALGVSACEMLSSLGGMHAPGVYIHLAAPRGAKTHRNITSCARPYVQCADAHTEAALTIDNCSLLRTGVSSSEPW